MKPRHLVALLLGLLLLGTLQAESRAPLKSGPQPNQKLPGPFEPLNVTGENAGEKHCLYCANGANPVAMIFAREVTPALAGLIKKIDQATVKNAGVEMGSFVVVCSSEAGLDKKLRALAEKEKLQKCILSIEEPAGPEDYKVSKDAEVTVVLYRKRTVKANHAFRKGELNDKAIEAVLADLPKILEE
jgi:hypothetical protein